MELKLSDLATLIKGRVTHDIAEDTIFQGFQSLSQATGTDISFFGNEKYAPALKETKAGVVIMPNDGDWDVPETASLIQVENPILAFDTIIKNFSVPKPSFCPGIHPTAFVAEDVVLDAEQVSVLPNAVVLERSSIGNGTTIGAGVIIGEGVEIGKDCEINANVSVREGCKIGDRVIIHSGVVVGGDGYGFEFAEGRHQKIEQLGIVRIDDDVEIGANTAIDRARFGETVIGEGTKVDNLVQIGHNVIIGKHCLIVAQTGISGSAKIGNYVTLAAQSGVGGHLEIADKVTCGGRSGVISSIQEPGGTWFGYPAKPMKESLRDGMRLKQLKRLIDRVKALEKKAAE